MTPRVEQLDREYDLGGERSLETHYYLVQSQLEIFSGKGVVKKADRFQQYLVCQPGGGNDHSAPKTT